MCKIPVRAYTCGCIKTEKFQQCDTRAGTNVPCHPIVKDHLDQSLHMCYAHMVKPGKDEMRR